MKLLITYTSGRKEIVSHGTYNNYIHLKIRKDIERVEVILNAQKMDK